MWRFLKKLEIELPCDPAIPLLGIHTEETRSERDTCTPMFIAALFIIAKTWKQLSSVLEKKKILELCYSKCGSQTGSINITWMLPRNAKYLTSPQIF